VRGLKAAPTQKPAATQQAADPSTSVGMTTSFDLQSAALFLAAKSERKQERLV
jgi:hypothetical protein